MVATLGIKYKSDWLAGWLAGWLAAWLTDLLAFNQSPPRAISMLMLPTKSMLSQFLSQCYLAK